MQNSIILCIIGIAVGFVISVIFNKLPAKWLCDYDEKPSEQLLKKRVKVFETGALSSLIMGISGFVIGYKYQNVYTYIILMLVLFALTIIFISDMKYMIIPDQFLLIILFCALFLFILFYFFKVTVFYDYLLSPLFGGLIGGGITIAMFAIGKIFYKKEVMGFGDVKLFFVCGLLVGANGAIFCYVCSILVAFFFFLINIILKRISMVSMVPFGPFICISTAVFMLFNFEINLFVQWYLSLL